MEKKSILKNSFYSICYKLMNVLFPLLISIYSSHVLLSEGVGKVALAQNIVTYFVTLAALGIPNYGTKRIGGMQFDIKERNKVFTELFVINLISTLICTLAFFVTIFTVPYFHGNNLYYIFSFLLILNTINVDWLYQGLEEYKYIAIRSICVKAICLIALPVFVRKRTDVPQYAIILCAATVGNYFFNIIHLHKYVQFDFERLNLKRHLKPILILLASVCATEIYTMLDSTMVGTLCSEKELGYYTNAMKTARMSYVFVTAACAVFLPRLSLYFKEERKTEFNSLAAGLELLADIIIPVLFGVDFLPGVTTLRILAVLVIILSVAYIGGHVILISANMEEHTMYAAFTGAISNFLMNIILIRRYGFNGAAIASVIAETLVTTVLLLSAKKVVSYHFQKQFILSILASTGAMSLGVIILKRMIQNNLISLVVCIIGGGLIYFVAQFCLKNEIVVSVLSKIRYRRQT